MVTVDRTRSKSGILINQDHMASASPLLRCIIAPFTNNQKSGFDMLVVHSG